MSDLISRQAAIEAIINATDKWDCSDDYLQGIRVGIRMGTLFNSGIPSVQPENVREIKKDVADVREITSMSYELDKLIEKADTPQTERGE